MAFDKAKIENLVAEVRKAGLEVDLSPAGASTESLLEVESKLGVTLPDDFKTFLREYGNIHVSGSYIAGVFNDDLTEESEGTVIFETLRFREDSRTDPRPSFLVLSCEGNEWYMGIDTKDGRVLGYDALSQEFTEQYTDFFEYLKSFLIDLV
ncbi:SMI1/KNR4 family protein [Pseudobacteriovorax antillogorgiicola]|uniref:SMI1-KNR4 cell-wall n=1 Tax=Pseudobacteriovorax antillogorgiicola TaxID=1513793 RepID=A0A1Y6C9M3_9BACT|nr:SMI1/KNR4 family protein [Pseudobacteriovorax antillogorgiicola]TCS49003.1 SUKH superfamily protein [Pseudobacteriovorax antillogorgiicola]SMF53232.1 SMI1-KNR4 cell-wall [Pseudobacteriovorax antillogorgiicola]